jgi:hypothetical protein
MIIWCGGSELMRAERTRPASWRGLLARSANCCPAGRSNGETDGIIRATSRSFMNARQATARRDDGEFRNMSRNCGSAIVTRFSLPADAARTSPQT